MMLSRQSIIKAVEAGRITISDFNPDHVNPASFDVRLGNTIVLIEPVMSGVERPVPREMLPPQFQNLPQHMVPMQKEVRVRTMDEEYPTKLQRIPYGQNIVIPPKAFILANTIEYFAVPNDLALYIEGRSSIGRMGLQVQNAGFIDPGFEGTITLELFNASDVPIAITPGRRIGQVTFIQLDEVTETGYAGKYVGQVDATASRIEQDYEVEKKPVEKPTQSPGGVLLG